jgi:hypothetical protein
MAARARTVGVFNQGLPLRAVRLADGALGVLDEDKQTVWVGHAMSSTAATVVGEVPVPDIPEHYGQWVHKSIGGTSKTVRRAGVLRPRPRTTESVTLFATHAPSADAIPLALGDSPATVQHTDWDETYGHVAEVLVSAPDVPHVAALIARAGAKPLFEESSVDSMRHIGIERLDRIDSSVTRPDEVLEDLYGLRRGQDNWRFEWLPDHWEHVPITWDHMVRNVWKEDIETLPDPLRQHLARACLALGECAIGTQWKETPMPSAEELADPTNLAHRVLLDAPDLVDHFEFVGLHVPTDLLRRWGLWGTLVEWKHRVRTDDGRCFKPVNTQALYERYAHTTRHVSAGLTDAQSKQLVTAFYLVHVEKVTHPETVRALHLILFHYMKERGYTARWLGKYEQKAEHIGNGRTLRRFRSCALRKDRDLHSTDQYNGFVNEGVSSVPERVLNLLWGRDGKIHTRGSKGTRSKHNAGVQKRYVPRHRLSRTYEEEMQMAGR